MRKAVPAWVYLVAPLLVLAPVLYLASRYAAGSRTQNVTMGDRALLVTAPELLEDIGRDDVKLDPRDESLRKERLPRGGRTLTYHYAGTSPPLVVDSRVVVELSESDAKATFLDWTADLSLPGKTALPGGDPVPWGEESRSATLVEADKPVGHALLARKGTRVVLYRFTGVTFPDVPRLAAHLGPRLRAVEGFAP